jgi:hypothetical protein
MKTYEIDVNGDIFKNVRFDSASNDYIYIGKHGKLKLPDVKVVSETAIIENSAPPALYDEGAVKAECRRYIWAVANNETQVNLMGEATSNAIRAEFIKFRKANQAACALAITNKTPFADIKWVTPKPDLKERIKTLTKSQD